MESGLILMHMQKWSTSKHIKGTFHLNLFIFIHYSQMSNMAFLMVDLDFGLIHQNISIKKASFQY